MKLNIGCSIRVLAVASLAGVMWASAAHAAVYSKSIIPGSVANAGADDMLQNCLGSEGCFYKTGFGTGAGISLDDMTFGGAIPASVQLKFKVSAAEKTAITNAPSGTATLLVKAARDVGLRQATNDGQGTITFNAPTEWLTVQIGGSTFGDLFKNTEATCPPGETLGSANCGPNFHTDIQATDSSGPISQATLLGAIVNDPTFGDRIQINLNPTAAVGRLKIFEATLTFVPEPSIVAALALGGILLGWRFRHSSTMKT